MAETSVPSQGGAASLRAETSTEAMTGDVTLLAGDNVVLTQDEVAKTITIDSASGSPAGSDTEIQFNDDGDFGASPDLTFSNASGSYLTVLDVADAGAFLALGSESGSGISFTDETGIAGEYAYITAGTVSGLVEIHSAEGNVKVTTPLGAFIPPLLTTTQRDAISPTVEGMVIYNTTTHKLNVYTTEWEAVTSAA